MAPSKSFILSVPLIALCLAGCASTGGASADQPRVSYSRSEDVTRYTSPRIRLVQEVHLARFPISLTISGGCEGRDSHCRPDDLLWQFVVPPDFAQYLGSDQIDFLVDDQYFSFHMDVYQARIGEVRYSRQARFRIPFSFTERVGHANDVVIKLGGNDIRIDERRRATIKTFVDTMLSDT